jgi:hypothetical protein
MTPEELRREIYETILKRRIFLADRIEKVEKALLSLDLIPKEQLFCSPSMLTDLKNALLADDERLLKEVYNQVMGEKEEFWFDIYRSLNQANSIEQQEMEKKKRVRIERRKRKVLR